MSGSEMPRLKNCWAGEISSGCRGGSRTFKMVDQNERRRRELSGGVWGHAPQKLLKI